MKARVKHFTNTSGEAMIEVFRAFGAKRMKFEGYKLLFTENSIFSGDTRDIYKEVTK